MIRRLALPAALIIALAGPAIAEPPTEEEIAANLEGLTVMQSFAEFGEPLYPADFEHFDYVNPNAPKGGSVTLGAFGTFERLDTIVLGGTWAAGIGLAGGSLFAGSGDELASYYPEIAVSVAVPDDLSFAIFTLHPEARYHDGHPITAEDFVFAYDHIMENGRPLLRDFWSDITSATALNERQVRFDFATVNNRRTLGFAAGFSPSPVHFWEETGRDPTQSYLEPVVGYGPYEITNVDAGRSITYQRVEDWWAADLPVHRGQNNFDEIRYIYFRDISVMFEAFLGGQFDFWSENQASRWATGYDVPQVARGDIVRVTFPENTPRGFVGFVFNTRKPIFQDIRVRQAISLLFDFEWTQENVFFGSYRRINSLFPNSEFGIEEFPLPTDLELEFLEPHREDLPPELFTEPFQLPVTDGTGRIRNELREALRLFTEAGWEVQDTVLRNVETGEPFTFQLLMRGGDEAFLRVTEPFIANLRRAGISATIRQVDTAQYERLTDDFEYDMIYTAANFFPPPGAEMRGYFSSETRDEIGSANWAGVQDPVADVLIEQLMQERDDIDRLAAVNRALDRVLLRGYYILPTYINDEIRVAYWNFFDRPDQPPYYGVGFPATWWWDEDRARSTQRGR